MTRLAPLMRWKATDMLRAELVLLIAFAYFLRVQFATNSIIERDGHFHIKYAYLMRTQGWVPTRSWLADTILGGRFADHHFLYHIILIPFTYLHLVFAAKLAPVVLSTVMLLVFFLVLRRLRAPFPEFWALSLLAAGHPFIYRMSMCRVQNVSLTFMLAGFVLLYERRVFGTMTLAFSYTWLYLSAAIFMPMMNVLGVCSEVLRGERPSGRLVAAAAGGWALGYVVNPFFPATVTFGITDILLKLPHAYSVPVGNEWYGYTSSFLLSSSAYTFILLFAGLLGWPLCAEKPKRDTLLAFLLAVLFGYGTLRARRFVEYWPAWVVLFCALVVRDWLAAPASERFRTDTGRNILRGVGGIAVITAVCCGVVNFRAAVKDIAGSNNTYRYYPAAHWLDQHTHDGEVIFNSDWDDFPEFFLHNSKDSFVVGLDPAYMDMKSHEKYELWRAITTGHVADPSTYIRRVFGARYVFSNRDKTALLDALRRDPGAALVHADPVCVVYRVFPVRHPGSNAK